MRVADNTGTGCGAAAGDTEKFTDCLAGNFCAGIQQPGNDRGIEIRDKPFQYRSAVHHGNVGDKDIILEGNRPCL